MLIYLSYLKMQYLSTFALFLPVFRYTQREYRTLDQSCSWRSLVKIKTRGRFLKVGQRCVLFSLRSSFFAVVIRVAIVFLVAADLRRTNEHSRIAT